MAKKRGRPKNAEPVEKTVLYLEVPVSLKEAMDDLARQHNRKLTGECIQALQEYLARNAPIAE